MSYLVRVAVRPTVGAPTVDMFFQVSTGLTEVRTIGTDTAYRYLNDAGTDFVTPLLHGLSWECMEVLAPENVGQPTVKRSLRRILGSVQEVFE